MKKKRFKISGVVEVVVRHSVSGSFFVEATSKAEAIKKLISVDGKNGLRGDITFESDGIVELNEAAARINGVVNDEEYDLVKINFSSDEIKDAEDKE